MTQPDDVLVRVENLKKHFPIKAGVFRSTVGYVHAVDGISFDIQRGETLGLVGESGCGKSTAARTILHLYEPTEGSIYFDGHELTTLSSSELRHMRQNMQIIFQDTLSSLNPRITVGTTIGEPLQLHTDMTSAQRKKRVDELLERVGLSSQMAGRFPHELSGGQRQRIGIARAIALNPSFIVADEPITSLDVSIQAQIVNLLEDLQSEFNLTYLFITHDLSMVRHLCDRVAVMYLGKIVEVGTVEDIYLNPQHPYTKALLSAIPVPDPEIESQRQQILLEGDLPSPVNPPLGCNFNTRCPVAISRCFKEEPLLKPAPDIHHEAACFVVEENIQKNVFEGG